MDIRQRLSNVKGNLVIFFLNLFQICWSNDIAIYFCLKKNYHIILFISCFKEKEKKFVVMDTSETLREITAQV